MPRARNIKPGFFKDARVVQCSHSARLCFVGLWCLADYTGRLKLVPLEIKMELFPADNIDIEPLIKELQDAGLIDIYPGPSGTTIAHIRNFEKHQNPHQNERMNKDKSPLPCLPSREECQRILDHYQSDTGALPERAESVRQSDDSNRADSCFLIPDSCSLNPESTNPQPRENISTEYLDGNLVDSETGEMVRFAGGSK